MKGARILVTGGAGFIGSHLTDRLINLGNKVTVIDNLSYGKECNINSHAIFHKLDIRDYSKLRKLLKRGSFEFIFHLAASATTKKSSMGWNHPVSDLRINALGTLNLFRGCSELEISPKIVYISSAAVYGPPQYVPIDEEHPLKPISPYGIHKLTGEKYVHAYSREENLDAVIVRIFNSYGPRQPRYVMYDFYKKLKNQPKILTVLGNGKEERSFCYITDTIEGLLLAAQSNKRVLNLGSRTATSIGELAHLMIKIMSPKTEIRYTGRSWKGDIKSLVPDISQISNLGFNPKVTLREGLEKTVKWFKENEVT